MPADTKLKAYDFVKELTTQVITLASAILAFSVTFYKEILSANPTHPYLLATSWFLFLGSLIPGLWALGALSQQLNAIPKAEDLDIYSTNVRSLVGAQQIMFLVALTMLMFSVVINKPSTASNSSTAINGPLTVTGAISATGPLMATGSIVASGPISASGSVTVNGPVNATGPVTVGHTAGVNRPRRRRP